MENADFVKMFRFLAFKAPQSPAEPRRDSQSPKFLEILIWCSFCVFCAFCCFFFDFERFSMNYCSFGIGMADFLHFHRNMVHATPCRKTVPGRCSDRLLFGLPSMSVWGPDNKIPCESQTGYPIYLSFFSVFEDLKF